MQVTICGGGNAAHTLAGLLSTRPENQVNVYLPLADEAQRWQQGIAESGGIAVHYPGRSTVSRPEKVSADPGQVIPGSDLVLLALPAFAHEAVLKDIAPYLKPDAWVGALPARAGFEWVLADSLGQKIRTVTLFGLQTLPWACRIERYGQEVRVMGTKSQVEIATSPTEKAGELVPILEELLGVSLHPVDCFMCLTLANMGQVLHPGLMYGLLRDWQGEPFTEAPLFYQGVDAPTARMLENLSSEIQAVRLNLEGSFPCVDFSFVQPLIEWVRQSYRGDISDPSTLESCLKTNRSYTGLTVPTLPVEGGLIPDFKSRYLSEDVPYGLVATRGIAELAGVPTPVMDEVIEWSQEHLGQEYLVGGRLVGRDLRATRAPQRYGIKTVEQLEDREAVDG